MPSEITARDRQTNPDPDDWFGDQADDASLPLDSRQEGGHPDDWLSAREPIGTRFPANRRAVVVGALVVLVLVVGIAAAAGVFSSGGGRPAAVTTISATTTSSQPPPTTPTTRPAAITIAPTVTLKPGDTGTQVKLLQRALAQLGYSPGSVDGQYGTSTKTAVTAFQRAHNLTADGILGPTSLAALKTALSGQ